MFHSFFFSFSCSKFNLFRFIHQESLKFKTGIQENVYITKLKTASSISYLLFNHLHNSYNKSPVYIKSNRCLYPDKETSVILHREKSPFDGYQSQEAEKKRARTHIKL